MDVEIGQWWKMDGWIRVSWRDERANGEIGDGGP